MTDKTTLPPDEFDAFMKRLDEPPKVLPNLSKLLNKKPLWDDDKPLDIVTEPTGDVAEALDVRSEICKAISEMLDNPDAFGIYPTVKCYDRLEAYFRRALTAQQPTNSEQFKGFFCFMGVKICDITDENFDALNMLNKAVDLMNNPNQPKQEVLGDVDAAIMAVEKWKSMQRAGGYKHEDVLNKAYDVLNNHGLAIRTALGAQQPDVNGRWWKFFECDNCKAMYLNEPVSECDCAHSANKFTERNLAEIKAQPKQPDVNAELLECLKKSDDIIRTFHNMWMEDYPDMRKAMENNKQAITRAEQKGGVEIYRTPATQKKED